MSPATAGASRGVAGTLPRGLRALTSRVTLVAEERMGRLDGWLITVVVALSAFGLVMVYSASEALGYVWYGNANYFFERQLVALLIGSVLLVACARIDYHSWRRLARPLAGLSLALLVLVLVPHIGVGVFGARRWFSLGFFTLQPSMIAGLVVIVFAARWLDDRGAALQHWRGVRDYLVVLAVVLGLIALERDLGTTVVTGVVGFSLLLMAGARLRHLIGVVALGAVAGLGLIQMEAYRVARVSNFRNPFADPLNSGFQSVQALYALGSGGLVGVGLGNSIQKYQWLPEAHTDFIFAIIGEELGLIGTVSVVAAFLFLGWRGLRTTRRAPDTFGVLLAGGIVTWTCIQAFINIAAVIGLIPTTGIPLPFISYGGTSLVANLVAIGILLNVSAQGRRHSEVRRAHVDRWRRLRGPSDSGGRRGSGAKAG